MVSLCWAWNNRAIEWLSCFGAQPLKVMYTDAFSQASCLAVSVQYRRWICNLMNTKRGCRIKNLVFQPLWIHGVEEDRILQVAVQIALLTMLVSLLCTISGNLSPLEIYAGFLFITIFIGITFSVPWTYQLFNLVSHFRSLPFSQSNILPRQYFLCTIFSPVYDKSKKIHFHIAK